MATRSALQKLYNCSSLKPLHSGSTVYRKSLLYARSIPVNGNSRRWQSYTSSEGSAPPRPSNEAAELASRSEGRMMPFEEYTKQKYRLKWSARLAGIPGFMVGSGISAAVNVYLNPQIADFQAAEVEPVL